MSRYLFLAGGVVLVLFGVAHAALTPWRAGQALGLSPADPRLETHMAQTHIRLTRRTNVWRAWVGFNYSHSLGLIVLGSLVLVVGRSASSFAANADVFAPFAFFASAVYLLLATKYWFRTPILGSALCCLLFLGSWLFQE